MLDDFLAGLAEDVDVIFAYQITDLDIGAVHCAEGYRAVQHELHISGSAGFFGSKGDLFRDITCRDQFLGCRYVIVFYHDKLHIRRRIRVVLDEFLKAEQEMDDILCDHISRSCFCAEDEGYRF